MKKIRIMMLMICSICAFTACSDDDDPTPQNPVSNVRIPATAEIGTEIIVSGTGFASTAQFTFKGTASSADVSQLTIVSTGVTMTVPMSLTPGQYTLVLKQDGEWELGSIELTAASLPIIGLEIPEAGFTGQIINIGGNGYNETSKVYFTHRPQCRNLPSYPCPGWRGMDINRRVRNCKIQTIGQDRLGK